MTTALLKMLQLGKKLDRGNRIGEGFLTSLSEYWPWGLVTPGGWFLVGKRKVR